MSTTEEQLPSPPFHHIPGLPNFRDTGGYPISDKKMVRRGIVFRSSEPSQVTEAGIKQLQSLGITHVYDLRSPQELAKDARDGHGRQVKEWDGARRIAASVFLDRDYSPESIALRFKNYADESSKGFVKAYQDILSAAASPNNAAAPYRRILTHLASPEQATTTPAPVLLHCTAGKDRTGVICALILSLCGVADEVVAHEYSLTDLGLKCRHPEFLAHLAKEPSLRSNPEGAKRMVSSRKENMMGTLGWIKDTYGSVDNCVVELGLLLPEGIEQLRSNLVVDITDEQPVDWQSHAKLLS